MSRPAGPPSKRARSLAVAFMLCASASLASDWPRFRGPNGTGVSDDSRLPAEIGRERNVAWSAELPQGNSSPIIVGGRVFLTGHEGDERIVLCYDSASGKPLWRKSLIKTRSETFHPANGPTTPTPATDGRNVFVFLPEIGLLGYGRDGEELWRTPLGPFASVQGSRRRRSTFLRQERVKDAPGDYYASPVAGDGKIYLASLDGKVSVLQAGADWRVLSTSDLAERVVATPAIADGRVFVRTEKTLYAFAAPPTRGSVHGAR